MRVPMRAFLGPVFLAWGAVASGVPVANGTTRIVPPAVPRAPQRVLGLRALAGGQFRLVTSDGIGTTTTRYDSSGNVLSSSPLPAIFTSTRPIFVDERGDLVWTDDWGLVTRLEGDSGRSLLREPVLGWPNAWSTIHDVATAPDGDVFVVGGLLPDGGTERRASARIDGRSGEILWSSVGSASVEASLEARVDAAGDLVVLSTTGTGFFVSRFDGASGTELWRTPTRAGWSWGLAAETISGIALSTQEEVVLLNGADGTEAWRFESPDAIQGRPSVDADGNVFVSAGGGLVKLDRETGSPVWLAPGAGALVKVAGDGDPLVRIGAGVAKLDGCTGAPRWTAPPAATWGGEMMAASTSDGGVVLVGQLASAGNQGLRLAQVRGDGSLAYLPKEPEIASVAATILPIASFPTPDDGLIVAARTMDDRPFLEKLGSDGRIGWGPVPVDTTNPGVRFAAAPNGDVTVGVLLSSALRTWRYSATDGHVLRGPQDLPLPAGWAGWAGTRFEMTTDPAGNTVSAIPALDETSRFLIVWQSATTGDLLAPVHTIDSGLSPWALTIRTGSKVVVAGSGPGLGFVDVDLATGAWDGPLFVPNAPPAPSLRFLPTASGDPVAVWLDAEACRAARIAPGPAFGWGPVTIPGSEGAVSYPTAAVSPDGDLAIALGHSDATTTTWRSTKLDGATGAVRWGPIDTTFPGTRFPEPVAIAFDSSGQIVEAGDSFGSRRYLTFLERSSVTGAQLRVEPDLLDCVDWGSIDSIIPSGATTWIVASESGRDLSAVRLRGELGFERTRSRLPSLFCGDASSAVLSARNGLPPYRWTVANGSLPPGVALAGATGSLLGNPGGIGAVEFTARIEDSNGRSAEKIFQLAVEAGRIELTASPRVSLGGQPVILSAPAGFASYLWSTGETGPEISVAPLARTTYAVTAIAAGGCPSFGAVDVEAWNGPAWNPPGEATDLLIGKGIGLDFAWRPPAGGAAAIRYDLVAANDPRYFSSGVCLAATSGLTASIGIPQPWDTYFLVRASSACGSNAGAGSDGTPYLLPVCP